MISETRSTAVNLRRIRAFVVVADLKSVSEAARQLNLTAPAVSKSVHELERALDVKLLQRTAQGMELTKYGRAFYLRGKLALSELARGEQDILALRGGGSGKIVVGALPNGGHPLVPLAVARLLEQRTDIHVSIRGGAYDAMMTAVRSGDMDFFVGALLDEAPHDGIVKETLFYDEISIIAGPKHPLANRKKLKLTDLADQNWVLPDLGPGLRDFIDASFQKHSMARPEGWIEVATLGAMRTLLRETDRIAPMTRMRVREELDLGLLTVLPIALPTAHEPIGIVRRQTDSISCPARALLAMVREVAVSLANAD